MPAVFARATLAVALTSAFVTLAHAASHREAPLVAADPNADITDVYAFVSYDAQNAARDLNDRRVTLIMNVNPGQDPADGPNYFTFGDDVRYRLHIDNNKDGRANDVVYEFNFSTETRPLLGALNFPLPYVGNPHIGVAAAQGITALDGAGSEGLIRRQSYTVHEVRGAVRTRLFQGQTLVSVPSNVGPATMPNYEALAAQGVYEGSCADGTPGMRVFTGPRAETFYIDLGAVFDTLNLRRYPPALTPAEDADPAANPFGINRFSGSNVSTIALEIPLRCLSANGQPVSLSAGNQHLGVYASTERRKLRVLRPNGGATNVGDFVQVARMANPLVNELLIDTPKKDQWNRQEPSTEAQFESFYRDPSVALALSLVYGFPILPFDGSAANARTDLLSVLLKYPGQALAAGGRCGSPCSELLRLDVSVPPTAAANQNRLGSVLGGDPAGWPNGRRPNDDVTDVAVRVVGGTNYIGASAGDGVNYLADAPGSNVTPTGISTVFPFLPTPHDGKNRKHVDCDEAGPGANPCGPAVP